MLGMIDIGDRMRRWRQNWLIFVPYPEKKKGDEDRLRQQKLKASIALSNIL